MYKTFITTRSRLLYVCGFSFQPQCGIRTLCPLHINGLQHVCIQAETFTHSCWTCLHSERKELVVRSILSSCWLWWGSGRGGPCGVRRLAVLVCYLGPVLQELIKLWKKEWDVWRWLCKYETLLPVLAWDLIFIYCKDLKGWWCYTPSLVTPSHTDDCSSCYEHRAGWKPQQQNFLSELLCVLPYHRITTCQRRCGKSSSVELEKKLDHMSRLWCVKESLWVCVCVCYMCTHSSCDLQPSVQGSSQPLYSSWILIFDTGHTWGQCC